MSYEKVWANNEKLNQTEKNKLEKDGLEIFNDIPYYAEMDSNLFRKKSGMLLNGRDCIYNVQKKLVIL